MLEANPALEVSFRRARGWDWSLLPATWWKAQRQGNAGIFHRGGSPGEPRVVIPEELVAPGIIDEDDRAATAHTPVGHSFDLHSLVKPHMLEVMDHALRISVPGIEH